MCNRCYSSEILALVVVAGFFGVGIVLTFLTRNAVVKAESDNVTTGDEKSPDLTVAIAITAINMIQVKSVLRVCLFM